MRDLSKNVVVPDGARASLLPRRRVLAAALSVTLLAAGCGTGESSDADVSSPVASSGPSANSEPRPSDTVVGTNPVTDEEPAALRLLPRSPDELGVPAVPEPLPPTEDGATTLAVAMDPYADYGTEAAAGEFPRDVVHDMGTSTLNAAPERVVVLDVGELDSMVQLGVIPVGAVEYNSFGLPPFIVDQVTDTELVGTTADPNLEAIAALQPDLIISNSLRHEEFFDLLSDIAPTVFAARPGVTFKENFALAAAAVGREEQAAQVVSEYETKVQEVSAAIGDDRPEISIVQIRPDSIRFYLRANFLGVLLTDVGLPRSASQNIDDFAVTASQEVLADFADGDAIVLAVVGSEDDPNAAADGILAGDLWNSLPAVQSDRVLDVDTRTWIGGVGYGSAFQVLDELAAAFGSGEPS